MRTTRPYRTKPELATLSLGDHSAPFEIETSNEHREIANRMASQARRSIDIISRNLDPLIYDDAHFIEAVKTLLLENRRARVRVLVRDPASLSRRGHRLVDLIQRLSSSAELRRPASEHRNYNSAAMVVDGIGSVFRVHADRFEAAVSFSERQMAKEVLKIFGDMWETAEPDPNLRRLHL